MYKVLALLSFLILTQSVTAAERNELARASSAVSAAGEAPTAATLESRVAALEQQLAALKEKAFRCVSGKSVHGEVNRWSPYSTCEAGFQATGLQRVDLMTDHNNPSSHVNDFQCGEKGCRAWCIGGGCTVEARCCR